MHSVEAVMPRRVCLEGEVTIYRATELLSTIKTALNGTGSCALDLERVTEIDTAGVQLLLAAKRSARKAGEELTLVAHSEPVVAALRVLGLADELGARAHAMSCAEHAYGS